MYQSATRSWRTTWPCRPHLVLGALARGGGCPTYRAEADGTVWWATAGVGSPALVRLIPQRSFGGVELTAWGEGAEWAADRLPLILGVADNPSDFNPAILSSSPFPAVRDSWRRWGATLRTPATGAVVDSLVLAVLEQRVTGLEAGRSWAQLVGRFGAPVPDTNSARPAGLYLPPTADQWRAIPSWEWHRAGVDSARSNTIMRAMQRSTALNRLVTCSPAEARERLTSIPGIGQWTAAEVAQRALGDSDAVSFGDFHLAHDVVFALTGADDGDDNTLEELLEPARGHRYRVQRLCELSGVGRPRRGPRATITDHRTH